MKLLLLCVALLPLITADDPKPCCMPTRLEGELFSRQRLALEKIAICSVTKRILVRNAKDANDPSFVLVDYGNKKRYIRGKDYSCKKEDLQQPELFDPCLPSDAKVLAPSYYGPPGVLDVNTFVFSVGSTKMERMMTANGCYPVVSRVFGPGSPNGEAVNIYLSMKPSIADTSIFNVNLSNCTQA